jgi:hypothetical protein
MSDKTVVIKMGIGGKEMTGIFKPVRGENRKALDFVGKIREGLVSRDRWHYLVFKGFDTYDVLAFMRFLSEQGLLSPVDQDELILCDVPLARRRRREM